MFYSGRKSDSNTFCSYCGTRIDKMDNNIKYKNIRTFCNNIVLLLLLTISSIDLCSCNMNKNSASESKTGYSNTIEDDSDYFSGDYDENTTIAEIEDNNNQKVESETVITTESKSEDKIDNEYEKISPRGWIIDGDYVTVYLPTRIYGDELSKITDLYGGDNESEINIDYSDDGFADYNKYLYYSPGSYLNCSFNSSYALESNSKNYITKITNLTNNEETYYIEYDDNNNVISFNDIYDSYLFSYDEYGRVNKLSDYFNNGIYEGTTYSDINYNSDGNIEVVNKNNDSFSETTNFIYSNNNMLSEINYEYKGLKYGTEKNLLFYFKYDEIGNLITITIDSPNNNDDHIPYGDINIEYEQFKISKESFPYYFFNNFLSYRLNISFWIYATTGVRIDLAEPDFFNKNYYFTLSLFNHIRNADYGMALSGNYLKYNTYDNLNLTFDDVLNYYMPNK